MKKNLNSDLIKTFFNNYIYVKHHCAEVRVFGARVDFKTSRIVRAEKEKTVTGWFTDPDELICELYRLDQVSAYITVNPVSLARRPAEAKNRLQNYKQGFCCNDNDITVFRYFIVDIDPPRVGNVLINSTDQELNSCIQVRNQIIEEFGLREDAIPGISGNGAFILVRLADREKDEILLKRLGGFIKYVEDRYKDNPCKIDTQTINPSRHLPIPGTWKYRDPVSTALRPHRQVHIELGAHDARFRRSEMDGGSSRSTSF